MPEMSETRVLTRGFQPLVTWSGGHHIRGAYQRATEGVTAFYHSYFKVGSHTTLGVYSFKHHETPVKHTVSCIVTALVYSRKSRLYVAACKDLALRVFSATFELIGTIKVPSSIISLTFNDASCELYSGGIGEVLSWTLRPKLHNALSNFSRVNCSLKRDEWPNILHYDEHSNHLLVATDSTVYMVDVGSNTEVGKFTKMLSRTSITSVIHCTKLNYLIVGSIKGLISVWNCELDTHVQVLDGHIRQITGLATHHSWSPSFISCSLDKTVKMWNLDSMTECYSVHCEGELLGLCWEFPYLTCYGNYFVKMWNVSHFESHFASLNSDLVRLVRVEAAPLARPNLRVAKIVAQTDDGGVRLLSPITGEVMTTLFPMFSSQLLEEVIYSFADHLLFVLLKTNYVLVCDTHFNPCLTKEIWVPSERQHKISTLTLCNVILSDGRIHSFIFGGQFGGDIVLLHSTQSIFTMAFPCPAHDSRVTMMVGASNLIETRAAGSANKNAAEGSAQRITDTAFLSYGKVTDRLQVWGLALNEEQLTLELCLLMIVKLTTRPRHLSLAAGTVCIAQENKRIVMFRPWSDSTVTGPFDVDYLCNIQLEDHAQEEDHAKEITSLNACPYLKLFVTSSKDETIKVWSFNNELVSEINFGVPLSAVGFANPQGDLLVAVQLQVSMIRAADYLPAEYVEKSRECRHWDYKEKPVAFDPHSEFWYDSDRVPAFPLEQEKRALHLLKHPEQDLTGYPSYCLKERCLLASLSPSHSQLPVTISKSSTATTTMREFSSEVFQGEVDTLRARTHSHYHYYARVISNKRYKVTRLSSSGGSYSGSSLSSKSSQSSSLSGRASAFQRKLSSVSLKVEVSCHSVVTAEPWYYPYAELGPVLQPSKVRPVAPDGYIPNSMVRGAMNYRPDTTKTMTPLYRPPEIKHVGAKTFKGELDMYCWLLEKIVKKCTVAGVGEMDQIVAVMTEIFRTEPEKTEEATRELLTYDDEDIDLLAFLEYFSDNETIKNRFGEELYTHLLSTLGRRPSSTRHSAPGTYRHRSFSSDFSDIPSPSTVDYSSPARGKRSHSRSGLISLASTSPPQSQSTTSSSYVTSSVRSALKLKWNERGSSSGTQSTTLPNFQSDSDERSSSSPRKQGEKGGQRDIDSGATKISQLTIPSDSSMMTFSRSDESGSTVKELRSALRKSSIHNVLSPRRRRRPSSVTFAMPLTLDEEEEFSELFVDSRTEQLSRTEDLSRTEELSSMGELTRKDSVDRFKLKSALSLDTHESVAYYTVIKDTGSLIRLSTAAGTFVNRMMESDAELEQDDEMMKQVMLKSWFPDELRRGEDREATIDNIFRGLLQALKTDNIDVFGEACDTLLDLHESKLLNREQENRLTIELGSRLRACSSLEKQAGNLGPGDGYFYEDEYSVSEISAEGLLKPIQSAPVTDEAEVKKYRELSSRLIRAHNRMRVITAETKHPGLGPAKPMRRRRRYDVDGAARQESRVTIASAKRVGEPPQHKMEGEGVVEFMPADEIVADRAASHLSDIDISVSASVGDVLGRGERTGDPVVCDFPAGDGDMDGGRSPRASARTGIARAAGDYYMSAYADTSQPPSSGGSFRSEALGAMDEYSYLDKIYSDTSVLSDMSARIKSGDPRAVQEKETLLRSMEVWLARILRRTSSMEVGVDPCVSNEKARVEVAKKLLGALQRLGSIVCEKEILQAIMSLLVDEDGEVSERAREAITAIAGVKTRAELREMLIKYGIIKEVHSNQDEILEELARRLRSGDVDSPNIMYNRLFPPGEERPSLRGVQHLRPRRPSTPMSVVRRLTQKGLRGYKFSTPSSSPDGREKEKSPKPPKEKRPKSGEEILYTFDIRDTDLRTRGKSICEDSTRYEEETATVTSARLSTRETVLERKYHYRVGIDVARRHRYHAHMEYDSHGRMGDGRARRYRASHGGERHPHGRRGTGRDDEPTPGVLHSARHSSAMYRSLVNFPTRFSQCEMTRQWMLDVYGESRPHRASSWLWYGTDVRTAREERRGTYGTRRATEVYAGEGKGYAEKAYAGRGPEGGYTEDYNTGKAQAYVGRRHTYGERGYAGRGPEGGYAAGMRQAYAGRGPEGGYARVVGGKDYMGKAQAYAQTEGQAYRTPQRYGIKLPPFKDFMPHRDLFEWDYGKQDIFDKEGRICDWAAEVYEMGGVRSGESLAGEANYMWNEIYPVVRTNSKFLIDKSKKGFHSKAVVTLPPIDTLVGGGIGAETPLSRHNIIHVKLPKLAVQTHSN